MSKLLKLPLKWQYQMRKRYVNKSCEKERQRQRSYQESRNGWKRRMRSLRRRSSKKLAVGFLSVLIKEVTTDKVP